jgi:serine/threonine protein kinase
MYYLSDIFISPDTEKAIIFHYDNTPRPKDDRFYIEFWDLKNEKKLYTLNLNIPDGAVYINLHDVDFYNNKIFVQKKISNATESHLMSFDLVDGKLIFEHNVGDFYYLKSLTNDLIVLNISYINHQKPIFKIFNYAQFRFMHTLSVINDAIADQVKLMQFVNCPNAIIYSSNLNMFSLISQYTYNYESKLVFSKIELDSKKPNLSLPSLTTPVLPAPATAVRSDALPYPPTPTEIVKPGALLLGVYRVEAGPIAGGMGKIWRVRHTGWEADLALKRPHPELFQSERQKTNFENECEAWINLGLHPHVVSCHYVRDIGGVPSIFSEWMEGGSLNDWIYRKTRGQDSRLYLGGKDAALERALDISIQFARGLRYVHERADDQGKPLGLIHQDVKPENLLLTDDGTAKIADFGIARARAALGTGSPDAPFGATIIAPSGGYTPAYCSPEQAYGEILSRRTDVYSWAASVLEMFLGERTWLIGLALSTDLDLILSKEPKIVIPANLNELLRFCLIEDPSSRPKDFAEVEAYLIDIYRLSVGRDYKRELLNAARDTAGSLNNKALSMLDLGRGTEAEAYWEAALKIDPNHAECSFNYALRLWREAKISDLEALRMVPQATSFESLYYRANLHMEAGDGGAALSLLKQAETDFGTNEALTSCYRRAARIEAETARPVEFNLGRRDCQILAISQDLNRVLLIERWRFGLRVGLEVFDIRANERLSWHGEPDGFPTFLFGNFVNDNEYAVAWENSCANDMSHDRYLFGYYAISDNNAHFSKALGSVRLVSGPRTGLYGLALLYDPVEKSLEIRRLASAEDTVILTKLPFDNILCAYTNSDVSKLLVCWTDKSISQAKNLFHFGLWNVEDNSLSKIYEATLPYNADICETIDINFKTGYFILRIKLDNKSTRLISININNGEQIFKVKEQGLIFIRPMGNNIIFYALKQGQSYIFKYINALSLRILSSCVLYNKFSVGELSFPNINNEFITNSECILYKNTLSSGLTVYNILKKPRFNYESNWALSRIDTSLERIKEDKIFLRYFGLAKESYDHKNITGVIEYLKLAFSLKGYTNNSKCLTLKNKINKFCKTTGIKSIKKRLSVSFPEINRWHGTVSFVPRFGYLSIDTYIYGSPNRTLIFDPNTGECLFKSDWASVIYSMDSLRAYYVSDKTVQITNVSDCHHNLNKQKIQNDINFTKSSILTTIDNSIYNIFVSPDERFIAINFYRYDHSDFDQRKSSILNFKVYDMVTKSIIYSREDDLIIKFVDFSIDGYHILVSVDPNGYSPIFELVNLKTGHTDARYPKSVRKARFLPGGVTVLAQSEDLNALARYGLGGDLTPRLCSGKRSGPEKFAVTADGGTIADIDGQDIVFWDASSARYLDRIVLSEEPPINLCLNGNADTLVVLSEIGATLFDLEWDLNFPGWANWDEGARPYLDNFLRLYPDYSKDDFGLLIETLQNARYGWLRPEAVRAKLDETLFGW